MYYGIQNEVNSGQLDDTLPVMMEPSALQGSSISRALYPGLQQHSSCINNVVTYNLLAKTDAKNCLAILWKINFDFSASIGDHPQASRSLREIAQQLLSQKYLTLYSKPMTRPACTCLIQVGAKVEVERDKVDLKEVFIVQTPLQLNTRMGRVCTCQYMHTGNQHHGSRIYYIVLKAVNTSEINCSYWRVAI